MKVWMYEGEPCTIRKHSKYNCWHLFQSSRDIKTVNITWTTYIITQCNNNIRNDLLFYYFFLYIKELMKLRRNFFHLILNLVDCNSPTLAPDCYYISWTACSHQTELLPRLGGHTEAHSGHHHSLVVMVKKNWIICEGQSNGISYEQDFSFNYN